MKIALGQLNPTVGDLKGNADLILQAAQEAERLGADLLVTPELSLSGYPPKDLLLREGFVRHCDNMLKELATRLPANVGVLIGHPTLHNVPDDRIANAASLLFAGSIQQTTHKTLLPNYDVFDERRYFRPAHEVHVMSFQNQKLGVHICEDAWWGEETTTYHDEPFPWPDPLMELAKQNADLFINLSASPYEREKPNRRNGILATQAKKHGKPVVFVNQVGGNDDLVFDGHSAVFNAQGKPILQLPGFESAIQLLGSNGNRASIGNAGNVLRGRLIGGVDFGAQRLHAENGFS